MIELANIAEKSIYTYTGKKPGKTVAVFAGVHGNEKAGVLALQELLPSFEIDAGIVHFVFANPEAIQKNTRYIQHNLNRLFTRSVSGQSLEHKRAEELMDLLDSCDALLDLHESNSEKTTPFIICEGEALAYAKYFDFPIVSSGWNALEPGGADGYMFEQGKVGITLECGSVTNHTSNVVLAKKSVETFLKLFSLIKYSGALPLFSQKHVIVNFVAKKMTDQFSFVKSFNDFDLLPIGEKFATDGTKEYFAKKGQYIIFPRDNKKIGEEAFLLASEEK